MQSPIIYTSEYLRTTKRTECISIAIHNALESLHIEHRELKHTNDYWCRDYMPVMIFDDGTYSRYKYYPDYLIDKNKSQYITNQNDACKDINLFMPTDMNIIFDGGNYVRCGNKVIITDKIFMENPQWSPTYLLGHLKDSLCADIILLPWDMGDEFGHSDGMVAYIGDDKVLLNSCWENKKAYHTRLRKILDPHFEVIELVYDCKKDRDSWCYLNYLQLPNAILLPCLSNNADCENDIAAIETFKNIFPNLKIIPIYAKPLIQEGGALHCVTWEYIEYNNHKYCE